MKDWLHATKRQIENMTFEEAKEIVEKQIRLGREGGEYCPRAHTTHAYEIILERAVNYERLTKEAMSNEYRIFPEAQERP